MTAITHEQAIDLLKKHKAAESKDLLRVLDEKNAAFGWSKGTHDYALSLGLDVVAIMTAPQKQIMRAAQLVNCTHNGLVSELDFTHTRVLLAMREAGDYDLCTDAIAALAANVIDPRANTRGITRGQINIIFKFAHGLTTVKTKISNSVGKNGYMQLTGMTKRSGAKHAAITRNKAHPLSVAFYNMIDGASDGQLQALADKQKI